MGTNIKRKGYIQIFIAGALWGCIGIFMQGLSTMGASAGVNALLRQGFGMILMLPITLSCCGLKAFKIDKRTMFILALMGLFSEALFNLCYAYAVAKTGVATAAVLLYTAPVFVCIMSKLLFKEPFTAKKAIALVINLLGCTLAVTNGNFSMVTFAVSGVIMGVMAGFFYGLITILGKFSVGNAHPYVICFYNFLFGTMFLILFTRPWTLDMSMITPKMLLLGAGIGFFGTVLPYMFYMKGLEKPVEASKVPIVASVETVVAAILGVLIFSESMGIGKLIGIALVLLSIVIMNYEPQKKENIENI